jgi:hypothetical protein
MKNQMKNDIQCNSSVASAWPQLDRDASAQSRVRVRKDAVVAVGARHVM